MIDHEVRIARLRAAMATAAVDNLLVTNLTNVQYLTGFSGSNGQLVVADGVATFFTDPRYEARAGMIVDGADVLIYKSKLTERLRDVVPGATLGFEATAMTIAEKSELEEGLAGVELVPTKDLVETLRRVKDSHEEAMIREAVRLADDTFEAIVGRLAEGMTERDIALEIEVHMRRAGAEAVSFEPIVGSGPLSAHIHHTPSERELEDGDLVLLDLGARFESYCSDLTRTVVMGRANQQQKDVYALVLAAQTGGIAAIAPGASGVDVDHRARAVIEDAGYGDQFGHGLGHGVGLDIHEAPRLHYTSEDTLVERDVVTVEPGIYVVDTGGIRIEDCVLVTANGAEVLGKAPKAELLEIVV